MRPLKKLYYFLGSIHLAIVLIAATALFVIAGTFLEAHSESHLFSASLTYESPFFLALIWGFFVNILFSALRRWPFQYKHIPFLITHLGLLMLLGGVIIKSYYGVQGSMQILEGGTNSQIFLPHTHVIHVEKKDPKHPGKKIQIDFPMDRIAQQNIKFDDVVISLVGYAPHSRERRQTWIKGNQAFISGLKPIPVTNMQDQYNPIKARFHHQNAQPWNVYAISSNQVEEAARKVYLNGLIVKIVDSNTGEIFLQIPLLKALEGPFDADPYKMKFSLDWNFSSLNGLENSLLTAEINNEKIVIALTGSDSLINQKVSTSQSKRPFSIDLSREPTLLLVQDEQEDDFLFFFNPYGEIHSTVFRNAQLQSLVVYDEGFGGYAVQSPFPFDDLPSSRHDKEQAVLLSLAVQLRQSIESSAKLSSPLQLFKKASESLNSDFAETFLHFMQAWSNSGQLLFKGPYPEKILSTIQSIDWKKIPLKEKYACGWLCFLLDEMEEPLQKGESFTQLLEERGWPFSKHFAPLDDLDQMITLFAQQLWAASTQLPPPPVMPEMISAKALSAYLRAFGITLNNLLQPLESNQLRTYHAARVYNDKVRKILAPLDNESEKVLSQLLLSMDKNSRLLEEIREAHLTFQRHIKQTEIKIPSAEEMAWHLIHYAPLNKPKVDELLSSQEADLLSASLDLQDVILETPLTLNQSKVPPLKKWEDNHPIATFEIKKDTQKEYFTLTYDKYGTDLAWPILNGAYTLHFQPQFIEIPYKIRLQDARQVNYPGTNQPYSYESDIIVTDKEDQTKVEKTISMNNVHETRDGYRFYLASLSPPEEIAPQRVQIVVNHDPAKYILTYPGALILTLGIILLFWIRPYSKG